MRPTMGPTMRSTRRGARQRGFTLLEMLITMAITIIGLIGLLSLHVVTVKANEMTSRNGEAIGIAQATLEQYRNRPLVTKNTTNPTTLLTDFGVAALPIDVDLDTVAGRAGTTFNRHLNVTELTSVSTSLVKLRVEVSWTDDGAAAGADNGIHDHKISLELVRTYEEAM